MNPHRLLTVIVLIAAAIATRLDAVDAFDPDDGDVIVFYGDSITEQNQYTAVIEHLLPTRFHQRRLTTWNLGLGGDTAAGGNARYARDAAPLEPDVVLVAFGMNDGGGAAADAKRISAIMADQRALVATIAASGARAILLTPSPVDPDQRHDGDAYNQTLAAIADALIATGSKLGVAVIDQFHPLRELQAMIKREQPGFCMIPDGIHPDAAGHLAMAHHIARGLAIPGTVAELTIGSDGVVAVGATAGAVSVAKNAVQFGLTLPFLPAHVPAAARRILPYVPFQEQSNRFSLVMPNAVADERWDLLVDGRACAILTGRQLADGVDLALIDEAPWSRQARLLWEMSQVRRQHHFEAWRRGQGRDPDATASAAMARIVQMNQRFVVELGEVITELARPPAAYHVALRQLRLLPLTRVDVSPVYPLPAADFARALPPEAGADAVAWTAHALTDGAIDLLRATGAGEDTAVYVRVRLEAARPCVLRLGLGSDDGLIVIHNGERVLERNTMRAMKPGEDQLECRLKEGRNDLVFRINQGNGGFGFAISAQRTDDTEITILP